MERLLRRQMAGVVEMGTYDARFIESLSSDELRAIREAQAVRRWRRDAIDSLQVEQQRLKTLLGYSQSEVQNETTS